MITTKQRAYLRSLANGIDPIFWIGKGGIDEAFLNQVSDALEKRELIKLSVQENSDMTAKDASEIICRELNCEGVQVIGRRLVLYKRAKEDKNRKIVLP